MEQEPESKKLEEQSKDFHPEAGSAKTFMEGHGGD